MSRPYGVALPRRGSRQGFQGERDSCAATEVDYDCTIVIPTYNERENIEELLRQIVRYPRFRVLVVDDNSPDGTGAVVADMARDNRRVALLSRPSKQGLGTAYRDGFRRALDEGAQYILEMDADFSHDPGYLPQLVEAAETRYDLVVGSRYVRGGGTTNWGVVRRLISRCANVYAGLILGLPVADSTSGFRCYRRQVLEALDLNSVYSEGYLFQIEMVYLAQHAGFRIGDVPITFADRRVGKSKMSLRIVMEAIVGVWYLRSVLRTDAREQRHGSTVSPTPRLLCSSAQLGDQDGHG